MSSTTSLLLVLLASVVVSMVIAAVLVARSRGRAAESLTALGEPLRTTAATSLGTTGSNASSAQRVQGTGSLVLTEREVGFAQWRPHKVIRIPRADIVSVDATRTHAGKTMKSDVLRITWRSAAAEGDEESIAFFVRDLEPWLGDLGGATSEEA